MVDSREAAKQLTQLKIGNWRELQIQRLSGLPEKLSHVGLAFLGIDPQSKRNLDYEKLVAVRQAAATELDAMTPSQRGKVFAALFPKLAAEIEAAWQLLKRLPYRLDPDRRAFRAPNRPEVSQKRRGFWLAQLIEVCKGFDQDVVWFATWAGRISVYSAADAIGILLAAAIDLGSNCGEEVFEILCQSASGQHPIGMMGRHVTRGLLCCSRPQAWEFMEKTLLAAQRQEGLRQVILETVDEAHPEAFRRMLRLILNENLVRFSSVVRAVDVWFGFQWDSVSTGVVRRAIELALTYLDDPKARQKALAGDDAEAVYLALWAIAFEDIDQVIGPATKLLQHKSPEHRFAALKLLADMALPEALKLMLRTLDDDDLRLVAFTVQQLTMYDDCPSSPEVFKRVEKVYERFPEKKQRLKPILWPWCAPVADRSVVAEALESHLGSREPARLIPYFSAMDSFTRSRVVEKIAKMKSWDAATRETLFKLIGDSSSFVREAALKAVARCKVTEDEAKDLERLLSRKSGDLRRGVLAVLLNQSDTSALASAERLLHSSNSLRRLAGLELLRQLAGARRQVEECRRKALEYQDKHPACTQEEQTLLDALLDEGQSTWTLENGLGLFDPAQRTPSRPITRRNVPLITPAAVECVKSLDALVDKYRETRIQVRNYFGEMVNALLGETRFLAPPDPDTPVEKTRENLPLAEVWHRWWEERPASQRDEDGFEILRAAVFAQALNDFDAAKWQNHPGLRQCLGVPRIELQYPGLLKGLLVWLMRLYVPPHCVDYLLDAVETTLASIPTAESNDAQRFRVFRDALRSHDSPYHIWLEVTQQHHNLCDNAWTDAQKVRLWYLFRWVDEPVIESQDNQSKTYQKIKMSRRRPAIEYVLEAVELGAATETDVLDALIGPRENNPRNLEPFRALREGTRRKPCKWLVKHPWAKVLVDRVRDRVLQVELARGDTHSVCTAPALALSSVKGIDNLLAILQALGSSPLVRSEDLWSLEKTSVFSHLVRISYPRDEETPEEFAKKARAAGLPRDRQIALAFFAPQWARFVERSLDWDGFEEAVWWLFAHTKDVRWGVDEELRESWQAQISQRTPLSGQDLMGGAVDVAWFHRVYERIGKAGWAELDDYVKYCSSGQGHKRAQLFAKAMLGQLKKADLVKAIQQKRSQDAVRALGLLPLAKGNARAKDLLDRYKIIQEFLRTRRQFGAHRRESEKRAATIGLENLARTAGYPDAIRLQWAMEAKAVADITEEGLVASAGGVNVKLTITPDADLELAIEKDGKPLKSIPPTVKKDPKVAKLLERRTELKHQVSRIRPTLEQMMCRGTAITGSELVDLMSHPFLGPMLGKLVLVGEGIIGYPVHGGKALEDHAGRCEPVKPRESLRIAHALDLLASGEWPAWQHDCFARERIQPIKQVFREVYLLTEAEKAEGIISRRYAGQQVNPRQALALLGSRGWVSSPEEGVRKTFHEENIIVWLEFLGGYFTPAEVEGLTLEGVYFTHRSQGKNLELASVPPRLFSEVMRDLDLVVSVAHRGGVDPEASASTVEMRASLLRETLSVLGLTNVRIEGNRAMIDGRLGNYSVHLGSAVIHRMPGGALCVVPVHAQHRGRLFLPFADDDPKTAEVISKVLMLARDDEIRDPNILDQLRLRS
jgi:hypothetical protein